MNLAMEKSQGKLQNDAHLHDIIKEIKELAILYGSVLYKCCKRTIKTSIRKLRHLRILPFLI